MSAKQPNPPPGEPGYTGPPQVKPEPPPAPPRRALEPEVVTFVERGWIQRAKSGVATRPYGPYLFDTKEAAWAPCYPREHFDQPILIERITTVTTRQLHGVEP